MTEPHGALPILQEIGAELDRRLRAAERDRPMRVRRPSLRSRGLRLALFALVLTALAAAVALAAGGILAGAPVRPPYRLKPTTGDGLPIPASVEDVPISVPDPAGGPPWGLRIVKTTRGLGCVQVGRLVGGALSVLGQDGAFRDDGRFHPLPAQVFDDLGCGALDAHGNVFIAAAHNGVPASGYLQGCTPPVRGLIPPPGGPVCPQADQRTIYFGALGPLARSLVAEEGGRPVTIPTAGRQGAYLIVRRAARGADPDVFGAGSPNRSGLLPAGGAQPIRKIVYRGASCRATARGFTRGAGRPCGPPGYAPSAADAGLTQAQLEAPLSVRVKEVTIPARTPFRMPVAEVTFTARRAITRAGDYYEAHLTMPCDGGSTGAIGNRGNVAAGERLTVSLQMTTGRPGARACPGRYPITVRFVSGSSYSSESYGVPGHGASHVLLVGAAVLHVPRAGR